MTYKIEARLEKMLPYEPIKGGYRIRLDANESFFSVPENVKDEFLLKVKNMDINRYPDSSASELVNAAAKYFGVSQNNVVAANGSDELLNLIVETFLSDGDKLLEVSPDFSMYAFYAKLRRAEVLTYAKDSNFDFDINGIQKYIEEHRVRMVMFSNPCNPTGKLIPSDDVIAMLTKSPDTLFIVDEAYMDFANDSIIDKAIKMDNVIVLRTMSKAFAAAGLRLGFAVSNEKLTRVIRTVKSPYNVNSISQAFGVALLNSTAVRSQVAEIVSLREQLYSDLKNIESDKFIVYPSSANFFYIQSDIARSIYEKLKEDGIAIRYFEGTDKLRITVGSEYENKELIKSIKNVLKE